MISIKSKYDKIIIWGDGAAIDRYAAYMDDVNYIVDKKVKMGDKQMSAFKIPVYSPEVLREETGNILIAVSTRKYMDEIKNMSEQLIPGADVLYALEVFVHKAAHFGQCGEDAIVESYFRRKKIQDITYLEIGIPSPIDLSNTYHFYLNGSKGVCIEANPDAIADLERVRPRDKIVSCGVGGIDQEGRQLDFYIMKNHPAINTFSKDSVSFWETKGYECNV